MRPFRFRPAALLALRRKEEDAARDALQRTEQLRARADAAVARATQVVIDAGHALVRVQQAGATAEALVWHRTWITRLRGDVDVKRHAAAMSAAAVDRAAAFVRDAVQRRRVLERLHDKALQRYQLEASREHAREMDSVAVSRYFANAAAAGGLDHDDR